MDKKFYVTPEMEIQDVELIRCVMFNTSEGIEFVEDDDTPPPPPGF